MIKIAVCDDDFGFGDMLASYINELCLNEYEVFVDVFDNCGDFIRSMKSVNYDIVFMDIEFNSISMGVEAGNFIRCEMHDDYTQIIYVSANKNYALDLFDTRPLNFLIKPIDKEKLYKVLSKAIELCSRSEGVVRFKVHQKSMRILSRDILYISRDLRKIRIIVSNDIYEFNGKLNDVEKQINKKIFIRIHNSIIVNILAVKTYKKDSLVVSNGDELPISRAYKSSVKEVIRDWEGRL